MRSRLSRTAVSGMPTVTKSRADPAGYMSTSTSIGCASMPYTAALRVRKSGIEAFQHGPRRPGKRRTFTATRPHPPVGGVHPPSGGASFEPLSFARVLVYKHSRGVLFVRFLRKTKSRRRGTALFLIEFGRAAREEISHGFCTVPFTVQTPENMGEKTACEWGLNPI